MGITYLDESGDFLEQTQVHGVVVSADAQKGFCIEVRGQRAGEKFYLPPDTRRIEEQYPVNTSLRLRVNPSRIPITRGRGLARVEAKDDRKASIWIGA
jgi:hypothetical protein